MDARNSAPSYAFFARSVVPSSFTINRLHEIGGGFGDEDVAVQLRGQPIAAIDGRRAHRREARQAAVGPQNAVLIAAVDAAASAAPARRC